MEQKQGEVVKSRGEMKIFPNLVEIWGKVINLESMTRKGHQKFW